MKNFTFLAALAAILLVTACSNEPEPLRTIVKGTITVADSVDNSSDYSGIGILVIDADTAGVENDTLFYETTDVQGNFEGIATFPEKSFYRLVISRNGRAIGNTGAILAENDTLTINAELPGLAETLTLTSNEHEALKTYQRVDRSFQRVSAFAVSGAIPDSQLLDELKKWTDLYWQVYQKHENTLASYYAAEKSVSLLETWDKDGMLARIDSVLPADYMIQVALNFGKPYISEKKGFEAASNYMDSLAQITSNDNIIEIIKRDKIRMYFDSSRVREAKELLTTYEQNYSNKSSSQKWARRIRYDLNYLAPGVEAPNFSFITMEGDTVNNSGLEGSTYILEISPLANLQYQNDYDRTLIIHEIYKNYGLRIFTIPLDQSEITINSFFDERRKVWPVAKLGSFDVQQIIQKFNVVQVPTRFLIDENGVLIRKYSGAEFEDVIQGLNKAFSDTNSPS
jgi:peroxiredoxin